MNAAVSLYELTCRIRNAISTQLPGSYWVRAEISEGRQNANGHFYCRFIEKNAAGTDIASAAGIIWAGTYVTLRARFERETGQRFGAGIKVLVRVTGCRCWEKILTRLTRSATWFAAGKRLETNLLPKALLT